MKKIAILLLALVCFSILGVEAKDDVNTNTLYPVNSSFNVETEYFNYDNVIYNSLLDNNGKATLTMGNVYNATKKKVPVSISVGLFDSEKKNMGVVNYCSTKDLESDYAFKQLTTGENTTFAIKVSQDDYISSGRELANVAYVAVFSDNKYCKVGGKDNYVGLTIEEIVDGQVSTKVEKLFSLDFLKNFKIPSLSQANIALMITILVILLIYIIQAKILNALNKRMFNKTSAMAYIPIANMYLAVKLAFGPNISKIYLIIYLISIVLVTFVPIIPTIVSFVGGVAFIIVIIKLITKKYDLLYFENFNLKKNNKTVDEKINNNLNVNNNIYDINKESHNNDLFSSDDDKNTEVLDDNSGSDNSNSSDLLSALGVDLNQTTNNDNNNENDSFFNVSAGNTKNDNNDKENENNGSDLTDLFK